MTKPPEYIDKKYKYIWRNKYLFSGNKIYKKLPFKSIQFEQTPSFGPGPVYKILLQRHGKVQFYGISNIHPVGHYFCHISINEIAKLHYLIELLNVQSLKPIYQYEATCQSSQILKIVYEDNKIFEIEDYGEHGPIQLWAIQKSIHGIMFDLDWRKDEREQVYY